jgi:hypothetical protein
LHVTLDGLGHGLGFSRGTKACVIICGLHRSGTSAVARLVNLLGADIAADLLPADPNNSRGYWESCAIVDVHARLLKAVAAAPDPFDPMPLRADWLTSGFARDAKSKLVGIIEGQFSGSELFVVKDPRISRLLPLWMDLLHDLEIVPIVVVPFRNPLEVAASLAQRDRVAAPKALLLYFHAYLEAERASRSVPRVFVRYDSLLKDWRPFAERLAQLSGVCFRPPASGAAEAIDEFLTADLYHHRFNRAQMGRQPEIPAGIVEMFDLMDSAAQTGSEDLLRAAFDRLRADADAAGRLYRSFVLAELQDLRQQVISLRQTFETSTSWRVTAPLRWFKSRVLSKISICAL